jgi:O-antigen/teichoic acid export membrane protein
MKNKIKLLKNPTAMTWASYIVQFGAAIFLLPLVLINFDAAKVAIWFMFYLILGMSVLADFGFGPTIVRAVSYFFSGADTLPRNLADFKHSKAEGCAPNSTSIKVLINNLNLLYLFLALLAGIGSFFIGVFLIDKTIATIDDNQFIWVAFYIVVVRSVLVIFQVKWSSILLGLDKVALVKKIETIVNLIKLSFMAFLIISGYGLFELMLVELLSTAILLISFKILVLNWFKSKGTYYKNSYSFNKTILSILWPSTWRLGAIQFGGYTINNSASFVVSQINSPELIAGFLLTQRVLMFTRQVCQAPLYANLPKVFQFMAQKNYDSLKFFCSRAIRISLLMLFCSLTLLFFLGNEVLPYFNIERKLVDSSVLLIMCISLMLEMHHAIHSQIYMGSNHVPFLIPSLASAITIFGVSYMVVGEYGLYGVVITQLSVQLLVNNWYPVYLNLKLLNWGVLTYFRNVLIPMKLK